MLSFQSTGHRPACQHPPMPVPQPMPEDESPAEQPPHASNGQGRQVGNLADGMGIAR